METCTVLHYRSDKPAQRTKIVLPQILITFPEQGEKVVHYANQTTVIKNTQFALLASGNCLMTEKRPIDQSYSSTMLFFDNALLTQFFIKYASIIDRIVAIPVQNPKPFIVFEKDPFIQHYLTSFQLLQSKSEPFSEKIAALKLEELLLHLLEKYPQEMVAFQSVNQLEYSDFEIRMAVEQNLTSNLTLEELAFLCHTSVSTFKRKFRKLYHLPPGQYFLQRRMEIAASLLLQNENPGEIYYKVGYENHSSFSQSFKQIYGTSPSQYQQQK